MASDKNKRSLAVYHTVLQTLNYYGMHRAFFITVTLGGRTNSEKMNKKLVPFLNVLKPTFPHMISVHGMKLKSAHVHILAIASPEFFGQYGHDEENYLKKAKKLVREAKTKCRFGRSFEVQCVTQTPDRLAGYFRKNYYETHELRELAMSPSLAKGRALIVRGVPKCLIVNSRSFSANSKSAKKCRAIMTRLAELLGVPINDEKALSREVGLAFRHIWQGVFRLRLQHPGKPSRWGINHFATVFPHLKNSDPATRNPREESQQSGEAPRHI